MTKQPEPLDPFSMLLILLCGAAAMTFSVLAWFARHCAFPILFLLLLAQTATATVVPIKSPTANTGMASAWAVQSTHKSPGTAFATALHAVGNHKTVQLRHGPRWFQGRVVWTDRIHDLALVWVDGLTVPAWRVLSNKPRNGTRVKLASILRPLDITITGQTAREIYYADATTRINNPTFPGDSGAAILALLSDGRTWAAIGIHHGVSDYRTSDQRRVPTIQTGFSYAYTTAPMADWLRRFDPSCGCPIRTTGTRRQPAQDTPCVFGSCPAPVHASPTSSINATTVPLPQAPTVRPATKQLATTNPAAVDPAKLDALIKRHTYAWLTSHKEQIRGPEGKRGPPGESVTGPTGPRGFTGNDGKNGEDAEVDYSQLAQTFAQNHGQQLVNQFGAEFGVKFNQQIDHIEQTNSVELNGLRSRIAANAQATSSQQTTLKGLVDLVREISRTTSMGQQATSGPSQTDSKIPGWAITLAKGAAVIAAPQVAVPGGIGVGVAMWLGRRWWQRRKKKRPKQEPITDDDSDSPAEVENTDTRTTDVAQASHMPGEQLDAPPTQAGDEQQQSVDSGPPISDSPRPDEPAEPTKKFELDRLAARSPDYTTAWAEHAASAGKDIGTEAQRLALYVDALDAIAGGALVLPGVDNARKWVRSVKRWINREFTNKVGTVPQTDNINHRAFFAFLHAKAVEYLRDGTFENWNPDPDAAGLIDDWIAARMVDRLVFSDSKKATNQ